MNRMKKTFLIFLLLSALLLSACGQKTEAMTLPAENEVHLVMVTAKQTIAVHTKQEWITQFMTAVANAEPAVGQSLLAKADDKDCIKVDLILKAGEESTMFFYQNGENYYVQQPEQGTYQVGDAAIKLIRI